MQGSRKIKRSTGIRIEAGAAGRHARAMAEQTAAAMEAAASGETPAHKACEAVRKVAELHGGAGRIPTVREYFAEFPRTASESSEKNRARSFKVFLEYLGTGADRRIDTITPAICRGFVQHELRRVARGTVELHRGYVSTAFKRAVEVDDYMNKNPMAAVSLAEEARAIIPERGQDQQKRLPFTLEEVRFMIQSFPAPWNDMVAVSFYLGGLRLSDVCTLRWDAVNWREGYVRLVEVKTRNVSVNGFMMEPIFSSDVAPGKHAIDDITFMDSDFEDNGITNIETVELSFHIFDLETWDTIVDTEPVTVTF